MVWNFNVTADSVTRSSVAQSTDALNQGVQGNSESQLKVNSCVYQGFIRHRRFVPVENSFKHPIFMMYLDLDEVPALFSKKWYCSVEKFNLVSFKRKDYFKPEQPDLKQAVIDHVNEYYNEQQYVVPEIHSVRMLGHVRYLAYTFNPVVFYYCFNKQNELQAIVSEITNTPWGERHSYVHAITGVDQSDLPKSTEKTAAEKTAPKKTNLEQVSREMIMTRYQNNPNNHKFKFEFKKQFHVSPFNPMNMDYRWVFSEAKQTLHVHMDNFIQSSEGEKHFDATLTLEQRSFDDNFSSILIHQPIITVKVVWGIYWQAFKLWVKRSPFYSHPNGS